MHRRITHNLLQHTTAIVEGLTRRGVAFFSLALRALQRFVESNL